MAEEKVKLTFEADIAQFKKSVQSIPGITEAQVDKMVKGYTKGLKKIDTATADGAKGAKKLAAALGFGDKAEKINNLAESIGLIGPAGIAGAAGIIGAAGLVAGMIALTASAGEALVKIEALGLEKIISPTAARNVHDANDAMDAAKVAAGALTVELASGLAPAITAVSTRLIEIELFTGKVIDAFGSGALSVESWGAVLASLVLGPMKLFLDGVLMIHRLLGTNTQFIEDSIGAFDAYAASVADSAFAVHADTVEQRASLAINTSAIPVIEAVTKARVKSTEKVKEATAAIEPLIEGTRVLSGTTAQLAAVNAYVAPSFDDIGEKGKTNWDAVAGAVEGAADAFGPLISAVEDFAAAQEQQSVEDIARIDESITRREKALKAAIAAGDHERAAKLTNLLLEDNAKKSAEQKAARRAYRVGKAMALTQIAISAATATIGLLANPAIIAIPAPGNIAVAASIAGGLAALSAAAVLAAPAPKFHGGMAGDEVPATITKKESVLNSRASANLGRDNINALNAGASLGGGSSPVYLSIDGRQADQLVTTAMRSGKGTALALKSRKDPIGAGHYARRR